MKTKGLFCALAVVLCLWVYFAGLGDYGFIDPDEGRYSEIPREMIESGDFITPRLNYVKYFEKPIMHYWLTAAAFMTFGQNEFAGRLTPVTLGLLGCVMTYLLALRVTRDKRAAVFSALVLASSVLWFALSRLNITDMTLTFFFTGALYFFRLWVDEVERKRWLITFYVFMAFAVMTKGLIGVVLPGGIAVIYSLLTGQGKRILSRIFSPIAIAIFFAVCCVWFVPVCRANHDFFDFFFVREHFLRYTTTIHDRWQPFWFFGPVLLAGFVPWTGLLWDSLRAIFGKCRLIDRKDGVLLGLWFLMPFAFFSLSNSKLVTYILPCFPPLAVLAGSSLAALDGKEFRRFAAITTLILVPLALTGLIWPRLTDDSDVIAMIFPAAMLAVSLLVFWGLSLLLLRKGAHVVPFVLCVAGLVVMYAASPAFMVEGELLSHRDSAKIIRELDGVDDVVVFQKLMQGMNFYLARRTVTAEYIDELEFGAAQEPERKWFIDREGLQTLWKSPKHIVAVARRKNIDSLRQALGEPVRQWVNSADVVFTNF